MELFTPRWAPCWVPAALCMCLVMALLLAPARCGAVATSRSTGWRPLPADEDVSQATPPVGGDQPSVLDQHQQPEHHYQQPEHQHQQPEHHQQQPEHQHQQPEHHHQQPEHNHQQPEHQHQQPPAHGDSTAWEHLFQGAAPPAVKQALIAKLLQRLENSSEDTNDDINAIVQYHLLRDLVLPSASERVTSVDKGDRCSCDYVEYRHGAPASKYTTQTTLTIVLWAVLAVAAWYVPSGFTYRSLDGRSSSERGGAYQQLMAGILNWSRSSPPGQESSAVAVIPGMTGRRRRSLRLWHGIKRQASAVPGTGFERRMQRMARDIYQSVAAVPRLLTRGLQSWVLAPLRPSDGSHLEDLRPSDGSHLEDGARGRHDWQDGGRQRQEPAEREGHDSGHYPERYPQHYPQHYPASSGECHCGGGAYHGTGRKLGDLARHFLYSSYWIPLIGLFNLVAEEGFWWAYGSQAAPGFVRTSDYAKNSYIGLTSSPTSRATRNK